MYMINKKQLILISGGKKHKKEPWYDTVTDAGVSFGLGLINGWNIENGGSNYANN